MVGASAKGLSGLREHPAASLFPMMGESELAELAEDIRAKGLRSPIVLIDAGGEWQVLDGRNRLKACVLAGIEPRHEMFSGKDPVAFVVSANLQRRHLTSSQRALVAAEIEKLYAKEAKERKGGRPAKTGGKSATSSSREPKARDKAARALNVSPRQVQKAKAVAERAAPEIVDAVRAGEVSVHDAANVAELPKAAQRSALDAVTSGEARTLTKAAEARGDIDAPSVADEWDETASLLAVEQFLQRTRRAWGQHSLQRLIDTLMDFANRLENEENERESHRRTA